MVYDIEPAERAELSLDRQGAVFRTIKMMGGLCFMVDEKMALGSLGDDLMVRLSHEDVEAALDEPDCRPMELSAGPMKGFLIFEADAL